MRRPRHLSADERALWDRVADTAQPLNPAKPAALPDVIASKPKPVIAPDPLPRFNVGQKADARRPNDLLAGIADRLSHAPLNMDNKAYTRMKRGKLKPEARIDLHGMTMDQAHAVIRDFTSHACTSDPWRSRRILRLSTQDKIGAWPYAQRQPS